MSAVIPEKVTTRHPFCFAASMARITFGADYLDYAFAGGHFGYVAAVDAQLAERSDWRTSISAQAGLAARRGARSGRVAWQYVQDLAGRLGVKLKER